MKKRIISVIAFALAFVFMFSLAGCGKTTVDPDDQTTVKIESVLEEGGFAYALVRSENASDAVEDMVKDLRTALRLNFKTSVKFLRDTREYSADERELLIGNTNRPESVAALKEITDNRVNNSYDFIIKVTGNKIVINAVTEEALKTGVDFFTETFCQNEKTWGLLHADYTFLYNKELDTTQHTIAGNHIDGYKLVVPKVVSRIIRRQVEAFQSTFEEKSGYRLEIVKDSTEKSDKEILFGETNREESRVSVAAGTYTIAASGTKLVVKGSDDAGTAAAASKLLDIYEKAFTAKEPMTFSQDYNLSEKAVAGENDYKLVYNDEFNGALNRNMWVNFGDPYETKSSLGTACRARKGEGVFTSNGNLVLRAIHEADDSFTHRQTSNVGTHKWKYGIYEFNAKLGVYPGVAALWFNSYIPKGIPGDSALVELDLLEGFGDGSNFASNIHLWWSNGGHSSLDGGEFAKLKKYKLPNEGEMLSDEYHLYSYEWNDKVMNFCVDGEVFFSFDIDSDLLGKGTDQYRQPYGGAIVSNTMGAATYGDKWKRGMPDVSEVLIDYVRLYQCDADGGFSTVTPK